jgi:hypothetical protein
VGQSIALSGHAHDREDGALPASSLSWRVERHHNTHAHPYLPPTQGNNASFIAPEPEDLESAGNSYMEVFLTATDSSGRATTVTRRVYPRIVELTFNSAPAGGFALDVGGATVTTPRTITSWENWRIPVHAYDQRGPAGDYWAFDAWSDGGAAFHQIVTPAAPATYTAGFIPYRYPRPGSATPLRVPLVPAYAQCQNPNSTHVPPLNHGSCSSAARESGIVTVGDAGQGSASVRFQALSGDPGTPPDEGDFHIAVSASDVRLADGSDYTGSLLLRTRMRITDFRSGGFGDIPGTVADMDLSIPFGCVATPGGSGVLGATCSLDTTADTVVPGFALEGARTVVSALSVAVTDMGPDGSVTPASGSCPPTCGSGDEQQFLRQGLFAP